MSEAFFRTRLETALRQLDWSTGIAKATLIEQLAADPPAQRAVARSLVDGVYFSPIDVLNSMPPGAWQEPAPPPADEPPASSTAAVNGPSLPESLRHLPPPVLGAAGSAVVIGFIAGLVWLLRRLRQPVVIQHMGDGGGSAARGQRYAGLKSALSSDKSCQD